MVQCFVADCDHSYSKNQCSFYRLPTDIHARRKWEQLSGRPPDCSNENSRICSCHFIGGVKSAGPSLFKWSQSPMACFPESDYGIKEEPEEKEITSTRAYGAQTESDTAEEYTEATEEQTIITHFKEETNNEATPYFRGTEKSSRNLSHW